MNEEREFQSTLEPVKGISLWRDAWKRLRKNKLAILGMIVICVIIALSVIGPTVIEKATGFGYAKQPSDKALLRALPPSISHPMGTDTSGRDMLARVLVGARISLLVGLISTIVSLLIGVSYGATAGYFGGKIDNYMMRAVDILYSIPYMMLVIVLLAFFKDESGVINLIQSAAKLFSKEAGSQVAQLILLFMALGAVSWLTMARIVRGQVMSLKNQEFVLAARATGVSTSKIIFRHLIPNTLGPVIVYATLTVPSVMLQEAFLSFLGLGVKPPLPSLGILAADGIKSLAFFPWQMFFPGLTMALTLFSLNFLGDGLRDALDPQMRKE